jgi:hypothetical protein
MLILTAVELVEPNGRYSLNFIELFSFGCGDVRDVHEYLLGTMNVDHQSRLMSFWAASSASDSDA